MSSVLESLGLGGLGGLLMGIITALGNKSRINKLEDSKQDKPVCEERWSQILSMKEDIVYIRNRVDKLTNKGD